MKSGKSTVKKAPKAQNKEERKSVAHPEKVEVEAEEANEEVEQQSSEQAETIQHTNKTEEPDEKVVGDYFSQPTIGQKLEVEEQ